jgi:hypothetical protein
MRGRQLETGSGAQRRDLGENINLGFIRIEFVSGILETVDLAQV